MYRSIASPGHTQPYLISGHVWQRKGYRPGYDIINCCPKPTQKNDMEGEGILDTAKTIYDAGKKALSYASKASDFYGSKPATYLKNLLPNADETGRPSYPGERHAILKLPNGRMGTANYMG